MGAIDILTDILILTVYFICIVYVLYRAFNSLEDRVIITFDSEASKTALDSQFDQWRLKNQIDVKVLPQGPRPLGPLQNLTVFIQNGYSDIQVDIDWDRSSLTRPIPVPKKPPLQLAQRIIHLIPTMTMDLFQNQASSVVNPGETLSATLATEDVLARNKDNQIIEQVTPLVSSLEKIASFPNEAQRKYSLNLVVRLKRLSEQADEVVRILMPYTFTVGLLPGSESLPFFRVLKLFEEFRITIQPFITITLIIIGMFLMIVLAAQQ